MDMKLLRAKRKGAFWGKIVPYFPYILQSGVAVVLLILLIVFSAWYTTLLRNVPPGIPIRWIMLLLLTPIVIWSSFRTYLHQADAIFLLPLEKRMKEYLTPTFISGIIYKLMSLCIVLLIIWPLYIRADEAPKSLGITLLVLLVFKLISSYGGWQEIKMVSRRLRQGFRLLRWSAMLLLVAVWLWQPELHSLIYSVLLIATYLVAIRLAPRHTMPWEALIENERAQVSRVRMVLGWFIDMPAEGQKISRRRLLSGIGQKIAWGPATAYQYLLVKTLIRSELLGILTRLILLGILLVAWNGSTWWGVGIALFFVFLCGVQLASLYRMHEDSPAVSFYPLPSGSRLKTSLRLIYRIQLTAAILFSVPLFIRSFNHLELSLGSLAAGLVLTFFMQNARVRKWKEEEEE